MDYHLETFVLGIACGAGIVLFALFALWMHHKDAKLTLLRQSQTGDFFGKGMIWGFLMSLGCTAIAIAGMLTLSGGALPRLTWSAGVIVGIAAILALRWIVRQNLPQ